MKLFHYNNADDWEFNVKNKVSPGWYKANKTLGLALNVATPAALLFLFNVNLPTFLLAYIGFDACMMAMDYASIGAYNGVKGISWLSKREKYEGKVGELTLEEVNKLKEDLSGHDKFYKEKLDILNQRIEEYKQLNTVATPEKYINTMKYVKEMVEKMRAYSDDSIPFEQCEECIDWIQEKVAKIVEKSDELLADVNDEPDSVVMIVNTYKIYAEELMNIILKYQEATEEQQTAMKPKLEKLLDTFREKLDRLHIKITSSREFSLNVDIDYLTKRLNEDIEEDGDLSRAEVIASDEDSIVTSGYISEIDSEE